MLRNQQSFLPVQLPIEDLCSLSSRSLQSPLTATVPASTEDVLLKGFQMLTMENDRIETAQQVHLLASLNSKFVSNQTYYVTKRCEVLKDCHFPLQFFSWFAKLQTKMDQDENVKYRWGSILKLYYTCRLFCHIPHSVCVVRRKGLE